MSKKVGFLTNTFLTLKPAVGGFKGVKKSDYIFVLLSMLLGHNFKKTHGATFYKLLPSNWERHYQFGPNHFDLDKEYSNQEVWTHLNVLQETYTLHSYLDPYLTDIVEITIPNDCLVRHSQGYWVSSTIIILRRMREGDIFHTLVQDPYNICSSIIKSRDFLNWAIKTNRCHLAQLISEMPIQFSWPNLKIDDCGYKNCNFIFDGDRVLLFSQNYTDDHVPWTLGTQTNLTILYNNAYNRNHVVRQLNILEIYAKFYYSKRQLYLLEKQIDQFLNRPRPKHIITYKLITRTILLLVLILAFWFWIRKS